MGSVRAGHGRVAELFFGDLSVLDGVVGDFLHFHARERAVLGFDVELEDDGEPVGSDEGSFDLAAVDGGCGLPLLVLGADFVSSVVDLAVAFDRGPVVGEVLVPDFRVLLRVVHGVVASLAMRDEVVGDGGDRGIDGRGAHGGSPVCGSG